MSFKEWNEVEIQEVCNIRRGASPRPIQDYISVEGIPWVKIADATGVNSRFIHETKEFIKEEGKPKSRFIEKGTLILSNSATPGIPKIMNIDACVHDGWLILDEFKGIEKEYMYYMLIENRTKLLSLSNGSVFRNLKTDIVKQFKVNIPPIEEQKAIAKTLSDLDDKIEVNNKINKNLEDMAQAIFKHWFVDFEFPNEEGKPYKSSGGEMVDSELGMIPKGWEVNKIDEICDVTIGKTPPRKEQHWFSQNDEDIKWISIKDLGNCGTYIFNTSEYLTEESVEKFNVKRVPKNTVILSFKLTVGRIAITTEEMLTNEAIAHFSINDKKLLSTEYLYSYLKSFNYETLGSTSSIATAINSKIVKKIPILVSDSNILEQYSKQIRSIFKLIKNYELEIIKLQNLRDTLLPKLMSGEIRVPID